jgi:serine/threonine protein kinase
MSPEQVSGGTLDGRSDMFSFGVVLYEMLTGRRPFAATTRRDLIEKLIHAPPPPLQGDLPHWLRALITRALQKDPRDRFPSMRELVETLRVAQRLGGRSAAPALWLWPTVAGIVLEAECVSIWKIAAARKLTISYLPSAPLASDKLAVITTHPA